jgi:hypothetical protein
MKRLRMYGCLACIEHTRPNASAVALKHKQWSDDYVLTGSLAMGSVESIVEQTTVPRMMSTLETELDGGLAVGDYKYGVDVRVWVPQHTTHSPSTSRLPPVTRYLSLNSLQLETPPTR